LASYLAIEIEPALMREEIIQIAESFNLEMDEESLDLETLPYIATLLAQIHRYNIDVQLEIIEEMTDDYVNYLANLTREPSLDELRDAAATVCGILGLPEPDLSFSDLSAPVWKIPTDILQGLREE